jgi:cell wall-associated NlpC family hydrolase
MSAQVIHDFLKDRGDEGHFGIGSLSFYGKSRALVDHVGICLDNHLMIEAGGGDHTTTTLTEATAKGAFVRMRPIQYRRDFLCVISPRYQFVTARDEDPGAH